MLFFDDLSAIFFHHSAAIEYLDRLAGAQDIPLLDQPVGGAVKGSATEIQHLAKRIHLHRYLGDLASSVGDRGVEKIGETALGTTCGEGNYLAVEVSDLARQKREKIIHCPLVALEDLAEFFGRYFEHRASSRGYDAAGKIVLGKEIGYTCYLPSFKGSQEQIPALIGGIYLGCAREKYHRALAVIRGRKYGFALLIFSRFNVAILQSGRQNLLVHTLEKWQ